MRGVAAGALLEGLLLGLLGIGVPGWPWLLVPALILGGWLVHALRRVKAGPGPAAGEARFALTPEPGDGADGWPDLALISLLSLAMDRVTDAVLLVGEDGLILFANRGASELLGYAGRELLSMHVGELRGDYDVESWSRHWSELKSRGSLSYEATNRARDGHPIQVEVNATYFEVDGVGYDLALGRDVSQRKAMEAAREQALHQAERLAQTRSEFLANMSHEIRTPLNAILGFAQIGLRNQPDPGGRKEFGAILDAGRMLLNLVDDVLDFSKIEAGKLSLEMSWVELPALVDRVVAMAAVRAQGKWLDFTVKEAASLPAGFEGDPLRLAQVLGNLLANAVKFTDAGSVALEVERRGETLAFHVLDTGIGMSADQMSRLFLPFEQADSSTTRRFGGTGLGLAISQRLAAMMGGGISASPREGGGMRFTLDLPLRGAREAQPRVPGARLWLAGLGCGPDLADELADRGVDVRVDTLEEAGRSGDDPVVVAGGDLARRETVEGVLRMLDAGRRVAVIPSMGGVGEMPEGLAGRVDILDWPPRGRHLLDFLAGRAVHRDDRPVKGAARLPGIRVLVAEDNELNRTILEDMLVLEGARVECVTNGRELVDRVEVAGGDFDVVITDVSMPEIDGMEATRRIRRIAPGLPVVGLTAHVLRAERDKCLASGMVAHLGKPVEAEDLARTLLSVLSTDGMATLGAPGAGSAVDQLVEAPRPAPDGAGPRVQGAFDWVGLERDFSGKQALVRRLFQILVANHGGTPTQLRTLAKAANKSELVSLAHNLKGMAGNLRASRLQSASAALVAALRADQADALAMSESVAREMEAVLREAEAALEAQAGYAALGT
ncbi:MAG TPA: ATP-binding protein [Thiobacillaceae bacterium]|nr:ATP-binding protein [Thiobacillaceae bacterium]